MIFLGDIFTLLPVFCVCYTSLGGRSNDYPSRTLTINFGHVRADPSSKCQHNLFTCHLPSLLVSKLEGGRKRLKELMSEQIEVRLYECSQLLEETFRGCYWVSHSLYGIEGEQGRPWAMLIVLPVSLTFLRRDFLTRRAKNLSRRKMLVCYSPVLDKCQREVSCVTASCYT